jgi:cytochrome oxidase assembly protein ShyY1
VPATPGRQNDPAARGGTVLGVYRFLATPRWLGLAAAALLLAAVMVGLGDWQLHRFRERSATNARIDAGASAQPVPLATVVPLGSGTAGHAGPAPPAAAEWTRVRLDGVYDASHEILARGRTVQGAVGFEVLTPLVLADGTAVIVDRGWVPPAPGGALAAPDVPPAPAGPVTVVGRVRRPESGADAPRPVAGRVEVRRIAPARLATAVPHPLFGAYVTLDSQAPQADRRFVAIPADYENALQNAGYVVQWWAFAALTLFGYAYLARREAQQGTAERAQAGTLSPA